MALAKTVPVPGSGLREALIGTKGVNKTETPVRNELYLSLLIFAIFDNCLEWKTKHQFRVLTLGIQKC